MRLFSYKLTDDTGFAPNPFFDVMTLATCKPGIRRTKKIGDWIAGFTSKALNNDLVVGHERLIYLMKVTDIVKQSEYYENPKFLDKIPDLNKSDFVYQAGDNIYKPIISSTNNYEDFEMIKNRNHWDFEKDLQDDWSLRDDLSGKNVLVSNEFYYFGKGAITIPEEIRPKVPVSQAANGWLTHDDEKVKSFLNFIKQNYKQGIHDGPHRWPEQDTSWRPK